MIKNNSKIQQLQLKMKELELDYFLFVNNDKFFCEYLPESDKFIEYLTGFTGSNAYLIVTAQKVFYLPMVAIYCKLNKSGVIEKQLMQSQHLINMHQNYN